MNDCEEDAVDVLEKEGRTEDIDGRGLAVAEASSRIIAEFSAETSKAKSVTLKLE